MRTDGTSQGQREPQTEARGVTQSGNFFGHDVATPGNDDESADSAEG